MTLLNGALQRVLVFAPHADDDILGCGGLMKKVKKEGGEVHVVMATVGDVQFYHSDSLVKAETREHEFYNALRYLGVDSGNILFRHSEQRLHMLPIVDIITAMDKKIQEIQPTTVLIPYPSFHQDHKVVFDACFAALRPTVDKACIKMIAMYEYPFIVWDMNPELQASYKLHVDITGEIEDKVGAMACHESQVRPTNELISLENIRVWAQRRGMEVGVPYAEAYKILRLLI